MHDERIMTIVVNAFNGNGDTSGSDDYGQSFAWIDLDDWLEPVAGYPHPRDKHTAKALSKWVKTHRDIAGCRYAIAYIDSNGNRSAVGYHSLEDVKEAYRNLEAEYLAWEETDWNDPENDVNPGWNDHLV